MIEGFNGGVITLNGNGHGFTNQFLIEALDGGGISIVGDVTNLAGASIEAIGPNAFIDVSNGTVDNQGGNTFATGAGNQYYLHLSDANGLASALELLLDTLPGA